MPLKTRMARGKCARLLQYLAVGLLAVASPVGVNRDDSCNWGQWISPDQKSGICARVIGAAIRNCALAWGGQAAGPWSLGSPWRYGT